MKSDIVPAARAAAPRSVWKYQPLVPVAMAMALGVTADHFCTIRIPVWLGCSVAALTVWLATVLVGRTWSFSRRVWANGWPASVALLCTIAASGGAWHHVYWNVYPSDDVGWWCQRKPQPARLRAVLTEEPLVVRSGPRDPLRAMPERDRTICQVRVFAIHDRGCWRDASGNAHLVIDGKVAGPAAGQCVEILGSLSAPPHAMNPGEFDYANYLRGRRTRAVIHCDEPEAMTLDPVPAPRHAQWLQRTAAACERKLMSRLPPGRGEIAVALLLGRYELLEEGVAERYMQTGTMHILAISGQHLAVLAAFLWFALRFVPISRKLGAVLLGITVVTYAMLTGAQPPVLRAAVLVSVFVGAIVLDARSRRANPLALALIIVLAINPSHLFDRGLQLSFLAVGALSWIVEPVWKWFEREPDPLDELIAELQPWWHRVGWSIMRTLAFALVTGVVVWLSNVPLLAARFHLFSPIVVPLTIVLSPVATIALISGLGMLVVDSWFPALGTILAKTCGWSIAAMDWCVEAGSHVPCGYWYVAGPQAWWVTGFYVGLALVVLVRPAGAVRWRWAAVAVGWIACGFLAAAFRPRLGHLQCQILAVGNGSAAVLRLPSNRCVLLDAGQIAGPRVGARLIAPALWESGIRRLDAVFLSHADVDHFNGIPQLAQRFPIGAAFVPPHFARADQGAVRLVCDALRQNGVPIRVCYAPDRFWLDDGVTARILHPPAEFGGSDNEQSLVIAIEYRGQRLLVTGDVEGAGLNRLLAEERLPVDVLVSPHHGSRRANPPQLAAWCTPRVVVVSQGRPRSGATLESYRAAGIPVFTTDECGAITIDLDGSEVTLSYDQFPGTGIVPVRKVWTASSVPLLSESMWNVSTANTATSVRPSPL
jgi:competence protein ComEC